MNLTISTALVVSVLVPFSGAQEPDDKKPAKQAAAAAPQTVLEKVSYGIGLNIGKNMKRDGFEVDVDLLARGLRDALAGTKPLLSDAEIREAMEVFQKDAQAKQVQKMSSIADKNKKDGEAFLAENKKKDGVKSTASGLQYKVMKEGSGKKPGPTDRVTTHYRGTLIDGTVFDSSYDRGEPATFPVNGVIKGWTEALQLMTVGSKYQLFIPSALAYGERGAGDDIGPNATLVFEVELLSIK